MADSTDPTMASLKNNGADYRNSNNGAAASAELDPEAIKTLIKAVTKDLTKLNAGIRAVEAECAAFEDKIKALRAKRDETLDMLRETLKLAETAAAAEKSSGKSKPYQVLVERLAETLQVLSQD